MNRFISILLVFICFGCQPDIEVEDMVYFNDFENGDLTGIKGGEIMQYNGSNVIGNYFRSGFELQLADLPDHDYLEISFDLYIHDSWDGNIGAPYGPDLWFLKVDKRKIIYTSFGNGFCNSAYCPYQTYPQDGLRFNVPETGASRRRLPALCLKNEFSNASTLYRIKKTIGHNLSTTAIKFFDELTHPWYDKCDESWSVDNLKVSLFKSN